MIGGDDPRKRFASKRLHEPEHADYRKKHFIGLLFLLEYLFPSLIQPYANRGKRFMDLYITFLLATFVISRIILMILNAYREEKARADTVNRCRAIT